MTRVAAVDCGTNSLRLLVVRREGEVVTELVRRTEVVRLGEGVDATGRLGEAALQRVDRRCRDYAQTCLDLGVERVVFAATSATRDASNADALDAVVERRFASWGTRVTVLSGAQEARLTYLGAADVLSSLRLTGPVVVVDLGGGSTELVRGTGGRVEAAVSVDIGAVRLHERHPLSDPPSPDERAALSRVVDEALDSGFGQVALDGVVALAGVGGTVTTVTAVGLGLRRYDASLVHGACTTPAAARSVADALVGFTVAERRSLPGVVPGREDVIGAGALIWSRILVRAQAAGVTTVVTSESDLLDGLAAQLLPRRGAHS